MNEAKQKILDSLGDLTGIHVLNNQVLVVVNVRSEKTAGGVFLPDTVRAEDDFQSKVGLVVAHGPTAFTDGEGEWFKDGELKLHDWIVYRASDGWALKVRGVMCRMLSDTSIRMRVDSPEIIW
jgi:co-chaperonin GroES (HSP10)